jgi:hypothetical protein
VFAMLDRMRLHLIELYWINNYLYPVFSVIWSEMDNLFYLMFGKHRCRWPELKNIKKELIQHDPIKNPWPESAFKLSFKIIIIIIFIHKLTWVNLSWPFQPVTYVLPRVNPKLSFKTMIISIFTLTLTWFNSGWLSWPVTRALSRVDPRVEF